MDASRPRARTSCGDSVPCPEPASSGLETGTEHTQSLEWVLAAVGHELRTPLSAILGHADRAAEQGCSPEAVQSINIIQSQCEHVLTLLEGILDVSRLGSGEFKPAELEFEPAGLVEDVVHLFQPLAAKKDLELRFDISSEVAGTVVADLGRLRQVLTNLVSNALKFTETGRIVVRALKADGDLCFEVEDTGIGLSETQRASLFLPFRQAELSTQKRFGGSGLGLSISRGLIRAMGGDIDVVSKSGEGSTFRARVPWVPGGSTLVECREASRASSPQSKETARPIGARVLLAEDEPLNQKLLTMMLERGGAEVVSVSDGWQAFQAVQDADKDEQPFDLVLMDLHMPGCDGTEAALAIRGGGHSLPIVALTATANKVEVGICYESGFNEVASKPISNNDLIRLVHKWTTEVPQRRSA